MCVPHKPHFLLGTTPAVIHSAPLPFFSHQLLYPVHCNLLDDLARAMDHNHDRGRSDVTQYFLSHHRGLLHYGQYAVRLPSAVEKVSIAVVCFTWSGPAPTLYSLQAKMLQTHGKTKEALKLCEQSSGQRFPLSDLLHVPIQRVLKYPLLMKVKLASTAPCFPPSLSSVFLYLHHLLTVHFLYDVPYS